MAGERGGTSSTSYWYGGSLHPLVVERDGVNYRLIGRSVVESMAGSQPTRSYAHADHLGSVRVVTDDGGRIVESLSYDDYGATRIAGQSAAASLDSVTSFYRFQGQEQEIFPLAKLGIDDPSLAAWLDQLQLYHFPWRDYSSGLAAFSQTDPVPTEDSLYAALAANPVNVTDETGGIAVLSNTDARRERLLYELRRNGGVDLSLEDRGYLWNLLQEVRAETPARIAKEVSQALPLWRNRYENAFQEWIEGIEAEIVEDFLESFPNHLFSQEDLASIRQQAETIARINSPNREVASALDELSSYEQLNTPEKRASYESYRRQWLSTHERLIEKLVDSADDEVPDLFQTMVATPEPQAPSAQAPAVAAEEESSFERSAVQEAEEKAEFEVNEHHSEKSHEPHEPSGKMPDEAE